MKKQKGKKRLEKEVRLANRRLQSMRSKGYGNLTVIERALAEFEKYSNIECNLSNVEVVNNNIFMRIQ